MVVVVVSTVAEGRSDDFSCQKKLFIREMEEFFSGSGCGSGVDRGRGGDGGGALNVERI